MMSIIDRRLNPSGKSLPNRQRFLRIARGALRDMVVRSIRERPLKEVERETIVHIPARRLAEPRFRAARTGGERDHVLPGNERFVSGDELPKPAGEGEGDGRGEGSPDGEGEDTFTFSLTREEYLHILFEELELPDLAKTKLAEIEQAGWSRAGFSSAGSPANLNLPRTLRRSLARRVGLGRPKAAEIAALEAQIAERTRPESCAGPPAVRLDEAGGPESAEILDLRARLETARARARAISYIDPLDLRYNRFEARPKPSARAVMFCLMDVSGSMTEDMKDLAKRFFLLLHMFLRRAYKSVDIVFIRHTSSANEVDEETFFHSRETGGTVVSSALCEMKRVIEERYPPEDWNIYAAQASDGDNYASDSAKCLRLLLEELLPICQYFSYIEVYDARTREIFNSKLNVSDLWKDYEKGPAQRPNFAMRRVFSKADVFPVFHQLFARKRVAA